MTKKRFNTIQPLLRPPTQDEAMHFVTFKATEPFVLERESWKLLGMLDGFGFIYSKGIRICEMNYARVHRNSVQEFERMAMQDQHDYVTQQTNLPDMDPPTIYLETV